MKLIWWHDYTTEEQDELLKLWEEMEVVDADILHDMLQTVANMAYEHGLNDGKELK